MYILKKQSKKGLTVFPLFVPAGTILFFKFSRKKYQAKQCQKVRVQFKGVYNSRACTIRGNTVGMYLCRILGHFWMSESELYKN